MRAKVTKLANGLRVLTAPMPSMESATVTVWVGVGSRAEENKISGISHFLEHMVFKGSSKRPTAKQIAEAVDAIGGEFNAATSKDWTNFYIKARSGNLDTAFDVLSDMVLNPILSPEEIEKEKGVIVEEMAMYEDTPMYKIYDVFENLIFDGNTLGRDIIGTEKTVRGIKDKDFNSYRSLHYYADNIILTVAGGVTEKEVLTLAKKYFGGLKSSKGKGVRVPKKFQLMKGKAPKVLVKTKKIEQAHVILGFLGLKRSDKDRFAEAVMAAVLGQGMSSRMFSEVREKRGLAYSVRTEVEHYDDTGHIGTYAGVDPDKAEEAIRIILDQCLGMANGTHAVTKEELSKAKEFIKGHVALSLEDTKKVTSFFGMKLLFENKTETPEDLFREIDKVALKDIERIAKRLFVRENLNLAIIGPFRSKEKFEKIVR